MITDLLGFSKEYDLTAVLKIGIPGESGYQREKNPYAPRRPEFSWLHKNIYKQAGSREGACSREFKPYRLN